MGEAVSLYLPDLACRAHELSLLFSCTIEPNELAFKERRYLGVAAYLPTDVQAVLDALADGRLDMATRMITKRIKMDQVVEEGFVTLIHDKDNQVKILVECSGAL